MFRIYCGGLMGDEESSNDDPSPHLKAILVEKSFVFELHLEKTKLLGNMDMASAISSFYHLCFVFDLLYPKVCYHYKFIE